VSEGSVLGLRISSCCVVVFCRMVGSMGVFVAPMGRVLAASRPRSWRHSTAARRRSERVAATVLPLPPNAPNGPSLDADSVSHTCKQASGMPGESSAAVYRELGCPRSSERGARAADGLQGRTCSSRVAEATTRTPRRREGTLGATRVATRALATWAF